MATATLVPNYVTKNSSGDVSVTGKFNMSSTAPTWNASAPTTYLETWQNNGTDVAYMDKGGNIVPASQSPSTRRLTYAWADNGGTSAFTQNGNVVTAAVNSVSAPLMTSSNFGVAYVNTSSTTAGGYLGLPASLPIIQSATITYNWYEKFYLPAASTAGNTYTAYIGAFVGSGTANNANSGPFAGPYISYTHGTNSGKWVMGSAVNNTRTTANSNTAAGVGAWHDLTISLVNGTYSFSVDGVAIGTLPDANITSSVANGQAAGMGGIMILPDGANFTTNRVVMIDHSDFWVTGLA